MRTVLSGGGALTNEKVDWHALRAVRDVTR